MWDVQFSNDTGFPEQDPFICGGSAERDGRRKTTAQVILPCRFSRPGFQSANARADELL